MKQRIRWEWPTRARSSAWRFLRLAIALVVLGSCLGCDGDSPSEPNLMAEFSISGDGPNVIFTDESAGGPTQWLWDFGDGNDSTEQNAGHRYTENKAAGVIFPHVFNVSLLVCKSDGADCSSATKRVRVNDTGSPVFVPF